MPRKNVPKTAPKVEIPSVPPTAVPANAVVVRKRTDFIDRYASNVQFDQNIWGMRILFGEFRKEQTGPIIEQHTGITMPWAAIKLLTAYLEVNLVAHENSFGIVNLPDYLLPPLPPEISPEVRENPEQLAKAERLQKTILAIRERMGTMQSK